jgi:hypothetical protein
VDSSDVDLKALKPYHEAPMLVVANSSSSDDDMTCTLPVTVDDVTRITYGIHSGKCGLDAVLLEDVSLVASLRANSSISCSLIPQIIDSVNEISKCMVSAYKEETLYCFEKSVDGSQCEILHQMVKNFKSYLNSSLSQFQKPLDFLATKHKENCSYFSQYNVFFTAISELTTAFRNKMWSNKLSL